MGGRTLGTFRMGAKVVRLTECQGRGMQMKQKEEVAQGGVATRSPAKLNGRGRTKRYLGNEAALSPCSG